MTDTERAYLAGIIDGEGTIHLHGNRQKSGLHVMPVVRVCNTNRLMIDWLVQVVGHNPVSGTNNTNRNPKHKQVFYVVWNGKKALEVLRECYPFLVVKRAQAEMVLAHFSWEVTRRGIKRWAGKNPIPGDVVEKRTEVYHLLRSMNKRGTEPYCHV